MYAACVADELRYSVHTRPSIQRCGGADALVVTTSSSHSIAEAYNEVLDYAATREDLEALVLLHEDVEILDLEFEAKMRHARAEDPHLGLAGVIGARGVTRLKWWEGSEMVGRVFESRGIIQGPHGSGEVDTVDGLCLVIFPDAVREHRFDTAYPGFHGYDVDMAFQIRSRGRSVRVVPADLAHHTKGGFGDVAAYEVCQRIWADKWQPAPIGATR